MDWVTSPRLSYNFLKETIKKLVIGKDRMKMKYGL